MLSSDLPPPSPTAMLGVYGTAPTSEGLCKDGTPLFIKNERFLPSNSFGLVWFRFYYLVAHTTVAVSHALGYLVVVNLKDVISQLAMSLILEHIEKYLISQRSGAHAPLYWLSTTPNWSSCAHEIHDCFVSGTPLTLDDVDPHWVLKHAEL
jgi:hypothetical protein